MKKTISKAARILLVVTLVLGILFSGFGVAVIALNQGARPDAEGNAPKDEGDASNFPTAFVSPTDGYDHLDNEAVMDGDIEVFSDEESVRINDAVLDIKRDDSYGADGRFNVTLEGEDHEFLHDLSYGELMYLQGTASSPFGGDRILRYEDSYSYDGQTYLTVSEPYFEDVFDSLEICTSDVLSKDNFVKAYYADGVTSHFGNAESEIEDTTPSAIRGSAAATPNGLAVNRPQIDTMANDYSTKGGDLIVEIDYNLGADDDDDDEDEDEDDEDPFDISYGITGKFGIRDLQAHVVCDMPSMATFEELYFGLSGETFVDIKVNGGVSASAEPEATKKDFWLCSLEGLNNKRFPIAVFEFKGQTPVYISNAAFENKKESVIPSLYLILYADWEGSISLELSAGFNYTHSFNNGLRVFKDGSPCLSFENYPYTKAYDVESKDGLSWYAKLDLEAETDLTLFGGSVLFYIAGVNVGELSAARVGVEAQCKLSISADSKEGVKILDAEDTELYIRAYLKVLEAKVKLKAEGKSFLSGLSIDVDFEFALLDITLFKHGMMPDEYRPKVPISSMLAPTEFDSVMTMVFDVSGSMGSTIDSGQTKLDAAKEAAEVIVTSTESWADDYEGSYGIGIVKFADSAETVALPHIDYKFISECIATMHDGGGTSISSGINSGLDQLKAVESSNKIMILMTDGQDGNDSATLAAAKKAADEGVKIYAIGFGQDVDESILKQVAEETGGEYRFANTDSVIGIIASFMYAQQSSNAEVLTDLESTVGEGETSEASNFTVQDKNGDLIVTTAWPGSFLDTILIDPNGRVVDEEYPGAVTDESKIPSTITVKNPIKGEWSVKVKGIETSYEQEPFYTIVSFKEGDTHMLNKEMSGLEKAAAYCVSIGFFVALYSAMILLCLKKRRMKDDGPAEGAEINSETQQVNVG